MKLSIRRLLKKSAALTLTLMVLVSTFYMYMGNVSIVKADEIIKSGHVSYDVTNLNVRTGAGTGYDVITQVNGGFHFDIYDEVFTSSTYSWYSVGFYHNGEYTRGFVSSQYVEIDNNSEYTPDADFEEYLNNQGFPESYKDGLRQMHANYPLWVFVADLTGRDWNDMVENENVPGRSLISINSISSWKSTAENCYDWETGEYVIFDSGGWVQASTELVQYALDPRNFLNDINIFMFESLAFDSSVQNIEGVNNIIAGSFMDNSDHYLDGYTYPTLLMHAAQVSGVSPYHLATRIIQEQGFNGQGRQISGTVSGYEGYYNYYSQNAVAKNGLTAVQNGLKYAMTTDSSVLLPWDSRYKSVVGGAINLGSWYINRGQNTIYYEKFDIKNYYHQYMTNILAAVSESKTAHNAYSDYTLHNSTFKFTIPVYENMPESVCTKPTGDGSPNNKLGSLEISGVSLTPTFSPYTNDYSAIVDNNVSSINISAGTLSGSASVSGLGNYSLNVGNNYITITVTSESGDSQDYNITVVRKAASSGDTSSEGFTTGYKLDMDKKTISGIGVSTDVQAVMGNLTHGSGNYSKVLKTDGSERTGSVATGDKLVTYSSEGSVISQFNIVIYGDVNGDSEIDILDIVRVKNYIVGTKTLETSYLTAADTNHDGIVDILDIVAIKKNILGTKFISQ